AGHGLYLRLEPAAHRPGAVAEGAGILQGVPAPSGCSELQPGSGHGRAQEGTDTREPVARMLAGDAGASQNEAPADLGKARWQAVSCRVASCSPIKGRTS